MKYESLPEPHTIMDEVRLFNKMWLVKPEGTMIIAAKSVISGISHFAELAITNEQVNAFAKGALIQHAFPNLSPDEREFLLNGTTPEEWDTLPEEE